MNYISGRGNLACTIFVPWDCQNNCPFCTSKHMYSELKDEFNLEEIINKIKLLNSNPYIQEYVLTGGEPLSNLDNLKLLINAMEKVVYINTTLPMMDNIDEVIEYINSEPKIGGVNISRHLNYRFDSPTSTDDKIDLINKPIRINTVIPNKLDIEKLFKFIERYGDDKKMINLREDYRKITTTTLKDRNGMVDILANYFDYLGTRTCLVCNSEFFKAPNCVVCYHRGLEHSSYQLKDKCYVNDVLIIPNGKIYKDWVFEEEDLEFNKWLFNN
ncbi:MAG: radical SAM protein [Bacilli bacterium]|nr:radical SAM protein [Bacilli bacterium]